MSLLFKLSSSHDSNIQMSKSGGREGSCIFVDVERFSIYTLTRRSVRLPSRQNGN